MSSRMKSYIKHVLESIHHEFLLFLFLRKELVSHIQKKIILDFQQDSHHHESILILKISLCE
jgi:hypothetical protein